MNGIREIQRLNKLELENGVAPEASWHRDHADSAYIYIGGLPFDLSEGDIITIFSQFGEPTFVKLVRDKETGKSKGFAFLKYEDQRSTDLAVDNLGGATVMGRILKVDHTKYKKRDDEEEEEEVQMQDRSGKGDAKNETEDEEERRPVLREEKELAVLLRDHDEDDPMKEYLVQEKKDEVARALAKLKKGDGKDGDKKKHRPRGMSRDRILAEIANGINTVRGEIVICWKTRNEEGDTTVLIVEDQEVRDEEAELPLMYRLCGMAAYFKLNTQNFESPLKLQSILEQLTIRPSAPGYCLKVDSETGSLDVWRISSWTASRQGSILRTRKLRVVELSGHGGWINDQRGDMPCTAHSLALVYYKRGTTCDSREARPRVWN
ncbi:MAG: hypothetical protein Q9168_008317 [Polycauliona sp. 1 TL-2023]